MKRRTANLADAARRLGISYVTARNWAITGKLRARPCDCGRGWVVDVRHLATLIKERNNH